MFDRKNSILIIDYQNIMVTFKACVRTQRSDGLYKVFIRVTTIEIRRTVYFLQRCIDKERQYKTIFLIP